jgi:hypothetical protein
MVHVYWKIYAYRNPRLAEKNLIVFSEREVFKVAVMVTR